MPTFTLLTPDSSLYALDDLPSVREGNYCVVFLPRPAISAASLTLAESWTKSGLYVFLNQARTDLQSIATQTALIEALEQLVATTPAEQSDLIWIDNPADDPALWRTNRLRLTAIKDNRTRALQRFGTLDFRNFALLMPRNVQVALNPAEDGFEFSQPTPETDSLITDRCK
jgi:hypothetical protein